MWARCAASNSALDTWLRSPARDTRTPVTRAVATSCRTHSPASWSCCATPRAADLRHHYGRQLKELQYRFRNPENGRYEGGFVVSDAIGHQSGALMFR